MFLTSSASFREQGSGAIARHPEISIVCPVYGCHDCLPILARSVQSSMEAANLTWELLLVDDRGPDEPWPLIAQLAARDPRVRGLQLSRNHGQQLAI